MLDLQSLILHSAQRTAEAHDWGVLQWLCNDRLSPGAAQTLGLCRIEPGKCNPAHYHPNCEELLYVWSGRGRHLLDETWMAVRPGTTVRIPAGVKHQLRNEGDEVLVCVIAFSSGDRRTVFLEELGPGG
jgi:quercetin dioxygenase-like cupin family protein